jgi:hypothetical protein
MELGDVRRLAQNGLAAFPPGKLGELGIWLRDFGSATGDARYYALSDLVLDLTHPFSGNRGLPVAITASVDSELEKGIPAILDADDPSFASSLARQLHEYITQLVRNG